MISPLSLNVISHQILNPPIMQSKFKSGNPRAIQFQAKKVMFFVENIIYYAMHLLGVSL